MASCIAEVQDGQGHFVYLGRDRVRTCIHAGAHCKVELFLSDRGAAILEHWSNGHFAVTADITGVMTCKLGYNHHDGRVAGEATSLGLSHCGRSYTHALYGIGGYTTSGDEVAPVPVVRISAVHNPDDRHLPRVTCGILPERYVPLSDRWRKDMGIFCGLIAHLTAFLDYLEERVFEAPAVYIVQGIPE